jgi:aspartate oxidase
MLKTDFLVIGSGIAGLSFALKVADQGKVLIVIKYQICPGRYCRGYVRARLF